MANRRHTVIVTSLIVAFVVIGTIPVATLAGGFSLGSQDAQSSTASPILSIDDAAMEADGTAKVNLSLSEVPNGLSGFKINVTVSDSSIVEITGASIPSSYSLTSIHITNDNETVTVKAVDIGDNVQPGDTDVKLAEISLRGVSGGTVTLSLTPIQIDDDDGGRISPTLQNGTASVEGSETTGSESTQTETGSESTPTTTQTATPTPTPAPSTQSSGSSSPTQTTTSQPTRTQTTTDTPSPSMTASPNSTQTSTRSRTQTARSTASPASTTQMRTTDSTLIPTPTSTVTPTLTTTQTAQPGFGYLIALLAMVLWMAVARRRT